MGAAIKMVQELNIESPSMLVNEDGTIRDTNSSMAEIFGYTAEELKNKHINLLIPEKFRNKHNDGFNTFKLGKKNTANCFRVEGITKDGSKLYLTISVLKQKKIMLAVLNNSTKHEQLERQLLAKLG